MHSFGRGIISSGATIFLALALGATAAIASPKPFSIDSEDARRSLLDFGQQSSLQILFASEKVKGVITNAVHGDYEPIDALNLLLKGTALGVSVKSEGVLVVEPQPKIPNTLRLSPQSGNAESATRLVQSDTASSEPPPENPPNRSVLESKPKTPDATKLAEIVVTAQKRTENVQNVPASVSVVGSQELAQFHVTQLADIGAYVPGLQIDSGGSPGQTQISIRGIAPISGGGATVGIYIDDTPIGSTSIIQRAGSFGLDLLPYDVQRIEVLEGPQGTLYGANSVGGVLKYVLTTPNLDKFEARVGADLFGISGAGNPGGGARAMFNTPLIEDKVGFIASYALERTPGFIDNSMTRERGQNADRQQTGRLALLWQPNSAVSMRLGAFFQDVDSDGDAEVALNPTTLRPLATYQQDNNYLPQPFKSRLQYYTLDLNWDSESAKFLSASGYSNQSSRQSLDVTRTYGTLFPLFGVPEGISAFDLDLNTRKFTQEFRLSSPPDVNLEWLAGAFYTHEESSNFEIASAQDFSGDPIAGLDPLALASLPTTYQEYALFGDVTYHFTDRFDVSGGLRYAKNDQHGSQITSGALVGVEGVTSSASESVWTYNFSPRLHITKDIMTYVRIASGYQAGAPNALLPGVPSKVNPDTLTNYEVGLKSEFWGQRAILNVSAFDVQWKDIQVSGQTSSGVGFLTNGGTARSRGFEGEGTLRPVDGLVLEGTIAYTDAGLTQDIPSVGGVSGNKLPFIPLWSGSLRADYTRPLTSEWNGRVGGGLRLVGDRYAGSPSKLDAFKMGAYHAFDLNADISNQRWVIGFFVKNLANTHAYLTDTVITNAATGVFAQVEGVILQPRTIGISLDAKF